MHETALKLNDVRLSIQTRNIKTDACFPSLFSPTINTLVGCLVKVKQGEILLAGETAELSFWLPNPLFFLAYIL